jgi:sec-independent protein translocase protein TatB
MMKRMSFSETIFLFILALVVFGPKKLPEIARQIGKYMNEFKRASNEFKAQIEQEIAHLDVEKEAQNKQTILPPSAAVEGTASRTLYPAPAEATAVPATLAAPVDQPVSSIPTEQPDVIEPPPVATEALPASPDVRSEVTSSPTTQESHA